MRANSHTARHSELTIKPPNRRVLPKPLKLGFTLIELLVAISLLVIIALMGWRGLDSILRTRSIVTDNMEKTRGNQLTLAQLQSDCQQWIGANAASTPTLLVESGRLMLVRSIFRDYQPTYWQVVTYKLQPNGDLTRTESPATRDQNELARLWKTSLQNTAQNAQDHVTVTLQTHITAMTWRVWDAENRQWRLANPALPLVTGLELVLQFQNQVHGVKKILLLGAV